MSVVEVEEMAGRDRHLHRPPGDLGEGCLGQSVTPIRCLSEPGGEIVDDQSDGTGITQAFIEFALRPERVWKSKRCLGPESECMAVI